MFKKIALALLLSIVALEAFQIATEDTSFTSSFAHLLFEHNLHEVVPGKVYRAGEMTAPMLSQVLEERGIKTVLDLRMDPKDVSAAYVGEDATAKEAGASYLNFPLMGSKELDRESAQRLVQSLETIEEPLLIHCSSGTHRSGVVSAIYLMERYGVPYDEAVKQLSPKYGFFRAERELKSFFSGKKTIDNVLWRYGEAKKLRDVTFKEWVQQGM